VQAAWGAQAWSRPAAPEGRAAAWRDACMWPLRGRPDFVWSPRLSQVPWEVGGRVVRPPAPPQVRRGGWREAGRPPSGAWLVPDGPSGVLMGAGSWVRKRVPRGVVPGLLVALAPRGPVEADGAPVLGGSGQAAAAIGGLRGGGRAPGPCSVVRAPRFEGRRNPECGPPRPVSLATAAARARTEGPAGRGAGGRPGPSRPSVPVALPSGLVTGGTGTHRRPPQPVWGPGRRELLPRSLFCSTGS
jgi:hypothetical protein